MLTIYTHSPSLFQKEFWKYAARKLFRKYSGPDAVVDSLRRGLEKNKQTFVTDPLRLLGDKALVVSGTAALREMIKEKRAGKLTRLVVGPNIVTHPNDAGELLDDPAIDIILVPSKWVADFWRSEAPSLASKLSVWPAGVDTTLATTRAGLPLIYDKMGDPDLLFKVQQAIGQHRLFTYGKFKRQEYLNALATAPYLIYLSPSESQGLALQEAWAHDVPTLVNKSTHWNGGKSSWEATQINCPYLTPELGRVFPDTAELSKMVKQVNTLHPKAYCDQHLPDEVSTRMLLELL